MYSSIRGNSSSFKLFPQPGSRRGLTHLHKRRGQFLPLPPQMPWNGVDGAAGSLTGPNGNRPLFIYPESQFPLFLHSRLYREGIYPSAQNKCSFVFPAPCQ